MTRTRRIPDFLLPLATLVAGLALVVPAALQAQQHFPSNDDLRVMLQYLVEDGETPGIVLGILEADGSTRVVSYGDAGPDARPLGPMSVFEIGSINKTFTGALLADAVARGEAALEDPVSKYMPEGVTVPSRSGKEITLLHLATHTSGLPRLPDNHAPADPSNPYADYSLDGLYEFLSTHELRRDPGAEGEYSNLGFGLLGHAVARAAGSTYRDLVRARILEPLGMTMTGYDLEGDLGAWMTRGHRDGEVVSYWFATEAIHGAGGLRSNVEDMLTYLKANVGPAQTDLERAMRDAHSGRAPIAEEENWEIGLGWQVQSHEGRKLVMHGGGTGGFSTYTGFDPELGVGFVMLTNTTGFDDDIGRDFLRRGPPLAISEVDVPADLLADYVGAYEVSPGQTAVVRLEDEGWLTFQVPGNVRFRMHPESESKFFIKRAPWRVTFATDETGEVTGLTADLGGSQRAARKVSGEGPQPAVVAGNAPAEVLDLPITAEAMAAYVGSYTFQAGGRALEVRMFIEDGRLMTQATGQPATALLRQSEHEFVLEAAPGIRLVFSVEGGRAERVELHQGGAVIPGTRNP